MNEREEAIICVLKKRRACAEVAIEEQEEKIASLEKEIKDREIFIETLKARISGYDQALTLMTEPLESIKIELE